MFDNQKQSKTINRNIQSRRLELLLFSYIIEYRPNKHNVGPDAHIFFASFVFNLQDIRKKLCHPDVRRLSRFNRA